MQLWGSNLSRLHAKQALCQLNTTTALTFETEAIPELTMQTRLTSSLGQSSASASQVLGLVMEIRVPSMNIFYKYLWMSSIQAHDIACTLCHRPQSSYEFM